MQMTGGSATHAGIGFQDRVAGLLAVHECKRWLEDLLAHGASVFLPEVADYELRRELLRIRSTKSMARLDGLKTLLNYAAHAGSSGRQADRHASALRLSHSSATSSRAPCFGACPA